VIYSGVKSVSVPHQARLSSVCYILFVRAVFQVFYAIVRLVSIFMVDVKTKGFLSKKRLCNYLINHKGLISFPVGPSRIKAHSKIPFSTQALTQDYGSIGLRIDQRSNPSMRRDLISALIPFNVAPLFQFDLLSTRHMYASLFRSSTPMR